MIQRMDFFTRKLVFLTHNLPTPRLQTPPNKPTVAGPDIDARYGDRLNRYLLVGLLIEPKLQDLDSMPLPDEIETWCKGHRERSENECDPLVSPTLYRVVWLRNTDDFFAASIIPSPAL